MNLSGKLLIILLRAGMQIEQVNNKYVAGLSVVQKISLDKAHAEQIWNAVYRLSAKQGILAITWDGLQRLIEAGAIPTECLPRRALKLQWCYNVEQIERMYVKQRKVITELSSYFTEHGIRMMLLKGYGLSLCYPVPQHRPYGDIDIWLYGRQKEADALLRRERGIAVDEDKHHHTVFHLNGVMVENHYDFLNVHSHRSNREIDRLLKHYAESESGETIYLDGTPIRLPCADFNALFLLRHAAVHFAAIEIGLRHVADWAMFVGRYYDQIDWSALERTAKFQNMDRFLHCLNAISIDFLGLDAAKIPPFKRDEALERRVLNEIIAPEFSVQAPKGGGLAEALMFKTRRWWANRWKHRIVYREGLIRTFLVQIQSHLLKPKSLK